MSLALESKGKGDLLDSVIVMAVGVAVIMTNLLAPMLIGVYVDSFRLTLAEAGYTAAVYMAGAGAGAVLASWQLLSVRTPLLLAFALSALAIGNLASVNTHSLEGILAVRLLAGLGEGVGFALMGAGVARMNNPNRLYAVFVVVALLMGTAVQYAIPWFRSAFGAPMLFVPIAVAPACLLPFVGKFPSLTEAERPVGIRASRSEEGPSRLDFWSGIVATFVVYIAYGGVAAFVERMGVNIGISADTVAKVLGMGYFVALVGALAAILTAHLPARAWKIVIPLCLVAGAMLITVAGDPIAYRIGVAALFFGWHFFVPNLMGLMSLADRSGRLAAAVTGAMECGFAIGPAIAGLLAHDGSFETVALVGIGGSVLSMVLFVPILRHVRRVETHTAPCVAR
ncbi:MAG TPA: MFS transporter [Steroidobacteraceae bacterium]